MSTIKVRPAAVDDTVPFSNAFELSSESIQKFEVAEGGKSSKKKERVGPCEAFCDFALNVSSAHGLPNIFRAKTKFGRLIWAMIFFAGLGVAIWQGTESVVNYFKFPVTVEVKIVTQPSLEFPSVSVCNTNKLRRSAINKSRHRQMLVVDQPTSLPYYAPCVEDDFLCRDRPVCIKRFLLCDGIRHCGGTDTSDEAGCDYEYGSCADDKFRCIYSGSRWGLCIPIEKECDRKRDCYEGEDEDDCECKSSEFKCEKRGGCIPKIWVCDGDHDCLDSSDESKCESKGIFECDETTFPCASGNSCILTAYICDSGIDCPDGSDESEEACLLVSPTACEFWNQFDCGDGQCIENSWRCDSQPDCINGADESEALCGRAECAEEEIPCATGGGCGFPCDLNSQCPDDSDETNCTCATTLGYVYSREPSHYVQILSCSGITYRNYSKPLLGKYFVLCNNSSYPVESSHFTCIGGAITCYNPATMTEEPCKTVYPECYTSPNGQDYRGTISHDECLRWNDERIALQGYTGGNYTELEDAEPGSTVDHWFCRNPGGKRGSPWCFVLDYSNPYGNGLNVSDCYVGPPKDDCLSEAPPSSRRRRDANVDGVPSIPKPPPPSVIASIAGYGNGSSFHCQSGEWIPFWQMCNWLPDCLDGSDEWNLECAGIDSECEIDQFKCVEKDAEGNMQCIPKNFVCDEYNDCNKEAQLAGSSDEAMCAIKKGEPLPPDYYLCANGRKMIHRYDVCNTVPDCVDLGDDELGCNWQNGTSGEMQDPFEDQTWYSPYMSLVKNGDLTLFNEFESHYKSRPFDRVKGEDPPDWNGFVTFSVTPDYSDLIEIPKFSRDEVKRFGHQKTDFILQCVYDQNTCNISDIEEFQDDTYGNCFTFNPHGVFQASKTGSRFGLQMTLFLEQSEYISIFGHEAGVRVSINPPNIKPNPTDNGFTVKPGAVTSIGLRYNYINRQPTPYSKCHKTVEKSKIIDENGTVRDTTEREPYDRARCKKTYVQRHILEYCRCSDTLELAGPRCKILDRKQDVCKQLIYFLHQNDNLTSECPQQCSEVYYTKTSSTSAWPSENFVKKLLKYLHSMNKKTRNLNEQNLGNNIVRLEVYYEQLNYESTKEEPAYHISSLFGDIGGIIGLYIGFSVITLLEFSTFIFELFKTAFFR